MSIIGLFTQELEKSERYCSSGLGLVFDECHCFAAIQELICNECHWSLQIGLSMGIENRTLVDFDREQVGCFVPGHRILVTPTKVLSKKK